MSFTGRMRLSLLLLALLPPVVAVSAVYLQTAKRTREIAVEQAGAQLARIETLVELWAAETAEAMKDARRSTHLERAVLMLGRNPGARPDISPRPAGLHFLEIVDSTGMVLASAHRPGLVGNRLQHLPGDSEVMLTTEYDLAGRHAAMTVAESLPGAWKLYGGRYLDTRFMILLGTISPAGISLRPVDSLDPVWQEYEPGRLYENDARLEAVVAGSSAAGFLLIMTYDLHSLQPAGGSLLLVTALVSLVSILAAVAIGWYLTGKAKREVDNLIEASHRVADGDFSTPVMAYEEGEFAQLADSLSDMMSNLKRVQRELATAEKIAAWQAMGRKIAHEVKNPLTPIAISIDDLRRSHAEKLPEFDGILQETTATIKAEVTRLTQLLDQFVSFARMTPPDLRTRPIKEVFGRLLSLHRATVDSGRLVLLDKDASARARYDIDRIEQVLVNLVKNSLETGPDTRVTIDIAETIGDTVMIRVTDTGPGFPESVLQQAFEPKVSDKSGGFGLGLVICHRIIHDHGGELRVGNSSQGGAEITFTLPRNNGEDPDHR